MFFFSNKLTLHLHTNSVTKGVELSKKEQLESALAQYEKALQIEPQFMDALVAKGAALAKMNKLKEAKVCLEDALSIAPEDGNAKKYHSIVVQRVCCSFTFSISFSRFIFFPLCDFFLFFILLSVPFASP